MARKRTIITQLQRDERIFVDILTEVAIMLKLFLHFVPHFVVICSPYNRLAIFSAQSRINMPKIYIFMTLLHRQNNAFYVWQ